MDDAALTIWLCEQLGTIDGWLYEPSGTAVYTDDVVGVRQGRLAASPNRGVGVRIYDGSDDPETGTKTRRAQLRSRGAPGDLLGAEEIADAAFDRFSQLMREGVISEVIRLSFSPAGVDASKREERTDNYLIIFDNPEA